MTIESKIVLTAQDRSAAAFRSARNGLKGVESAAMTAQKALGMLGVGVSVGAVITGLGRAAHEAIKFGDEMAKAAAKTGVAGSAFSELAYAARQNDVQLKTLSTGFRTLQKSISEAGSGMKAPLDAFRALGIEFESFRRLNPDQQFEALAEQISRLKDPADRARAAVQLFGRAGVELLPLFQDGARGVRELREEAVRLGRALTDDQVKKLSEADLAIKNLTATWESFANSLTATVSPALVRLIKHLEDMQSVRPSDVVRTLLANPFAGWGDLANTVRNRTSAAAAPQVEWGGLTPAVMGMARTGAAAPGFAPDAPRAAGAMDGLSELNVWQRQIFNLNNEMNSWLDSFDREFTADFRREVIVSSNEMRKMSAVVEGNREAISEWSVFADQAARNVQSSFAQFLFDPFDDGVKGMARSFLDTMRQILSQIAANRILTSFFNWGSGLGGGLGAMFGEMNTAINPPRRAAGGPVTGGRAYLVGERGPELFVPNTSGSIMPNGAGGLVINVNNAVDARGATQDVIRALPAILEESNRRAVALAKSEIRGDIKRYGRVR